MKPTTNTLHQTYKTVAECFEYFVLFERCQLDGGIGPSCLVVSWVYLYLRSACAEIVTGLQHGLDFLPIEL
jgi:hypothetical protein